MILNFHIHYVTIFGEQLAVQYSLDDVGGQEEILLLRTIDGKHWTGKLRTNNKNISYQYVVFSNDQVVRTEWGGFRKFSLGSQDCTFLEDEWRARDTTSNAFLTSAFTQAIFKRVSTHIKPQALKPQNLTFILRSGMIQSHLKWGIIGNLPELGAWEIPVILNDEKFPYSETTIELSHNNVFIEYKYVIINPDDASIVAWENGENRTYHYFIDQENKNHVYLSDNEFRHKNSDWKGAGVAIPVFSLRSHKGMGIGEFSDLKPLVDWSASVGMKMIQVLPVNDTIATQTWQDSYPYAAISVFALHPLYINVEDIAPFKTKKVQTEYETNRLELNGLESVDFEKVGQTKFRYFQILFEQEYSKFITEKQVGIFFETNKEWLVPYAVFCQLRDKFQTSNFDSWPSPFHVFEAEEIKKYYNSTKEIKKACDFYIFLQYHADKQLVETRDYARSKGVALKGDLPIGIYRHSCDAWVAPHLYNMDEQAGAPPDDFAVLGQNWGFPTYNWEIMSQDNFSWWRDRMRQLNRYFDALRIDHILGFFRIWQVPMDHIQGTMGLFNPRQPFSIEELAHYGLYGDLSRLTLPYITPEILRRKFGDDTEDIMTVFFDINEGRKIVFKSSLNTQQKIQDFISVNTKFEAYKDVLIGLVSEILLIMEPGSNGQLFNPRITLHSTHSYSQLDSSTQQNIMRLYNEYFYNRHEDFWRQEAFKKLPAIIDASDMLICAEDLGMIPKSVSGVLKDLNILSLEIQRMPKGTSKYGQTREYPYFSVCSPSCHDMSTIRGWWEGDHENAKNYFYNYLHWQGIVPMSCEALIVETVINDHMASPSMWAVFPIQDLVGMDEALRKQDAASEQINEPSDPKHYWRFRFHIALETLQLADDLNNKIKNMIKRNGRG